MAKGKPLVVYLEVGARRVFACSVEWPGWCRAGRDQESALEALASYAPRYARVATKAGARFPADPAAGGFDVRERVPGNATTDFGAPGAIPGSDHERVTPQAAERLAAFVAASWAVLDEVAASAPATLRKGPRGGGRDRDAVVAHVQSADAAYARKIGVRLPTPALGDSAAIGALRNAVLAVLGAPSDGPPATGKGWPNRYAARRIAWHALDHAWEIEDKSRA